MAFKCGLVACVTAFSCLFVGAQFDAPTQRPVSPPTERPVTAQVISTGAPTKAPSKAPTPQCIDWEWIDNQGNDCSSYSSVAVCQDFRDCCRSDDGVGPDIACCMCGGGRPIGGECVNYPNWMADSATTPVTCESFDESPGNCLEFGGLVGIANGLTAEVACCACRPESIVIPTPPPTQIPTKIPTERPISAIVQGPSGCSFDRCFCDFTSDCDPGCSCLENLAGVSRCVCV